MRCSKRIFLLLFVWASLPGRAEQAAVRPFIADYQGRVESMAGLGRLSLEPQSDGRWLLGLRIENALAQVSVQTVFDVQGGMQGHAAWLRPLSNSYRRRILLFNSQIDVNFDWGQRKALWRGDIDPARSGPVELQAGDTEPLLAHLAVVQDFSAGRPTAYRDLENGRARPANYQREAEEPVTLGGRTYQATRLSQRAGKTQYTIWIVPGIPCPVRLLQTERDETTIALQLRAWGWQEK